MGYKSSGNATVDVMGTVSIKGNVIPSEWYRTIIRENGKPQMLAISLLADIVYWYRPNELRDQQTGNVIGWQKRFRGDLLQKSYEQYADYFGESKRSVKAAFDHLVRIGVIERIFRDIKTKSGQKLYNVMYIDLNVERLKDLSFPDEEGRTEEYADDGLTDCEIDEILREDVGDTGEVTDDAGGGTKFCRGSYGLTQGAVQGNVSSLTNCGGTLPQNDVVPPTPDGGTNTEITTEITYRDHNHINPSRRPIKITMGASASEEKNDGLDDMTDTALQYRDLVYENTHYYWHLANDDISTRDQYKSLVELICDIVCATHKEPIRINRAEYPAEVVKSRLLKITDSHIEYVMDKLRDNPNYDGITDERAYMLTCLYNAPVTMDTHYQQMVNHDMLGGGWAEKGII